MGEPPRRYSTCSMYITGSQGAILSNAATSASAA